MKKRVCNAQCDATGSLNITTDHPWLIKHLTDMSIKQQLMQGGFIIYFVVSWPVVMLEKERDTVKSLVKSFLIISWLKVQVQV